VHSYAFTASHAAHVAAQCDYGGLFTAAVARDNLFGTQFHPEKSQQAGQRLLANFLNWKP
jgi:glutamine amidotransferase